MATISVLNTSTDLSGKTIVTAEGDRSISGLLTFSRGAAVPFAVALGAASVTNLDADKTDGAHVSVSNGNRLLLSSGGNVTEASALTNGQLFIGSTGAAPSAAAITAGTGISVTNGAGSITIASTGTLDKSTTEQSVTNTTTLTSIYSFSVPGGTLSTNRILRLTITGEVNNTTGGASSLIVNVVWGGTNLTNSGVALINIPAGATHEGFELEVYINANGATNQQRSLCRATSLSAGVLSDGGWSGTTNGQVQMAVHSALAVDSTSAQNLVVNVQHGTASASISFKRWAAILELLG